MNIEQLEAKLAEAEKDDALAFKLLKQVQVDSKKRNDLAWDVWHEAARNLQSIRDKIARAKLRAEIEAELNGVKQ